MEPDRHGGAIGEVRVGLPGGLWLGEESATPLREVGLRALQDEDQCFALDLGDRLPPASRVTALLARCMSGGESAARALTVGDREALLLHLRRLTFGETMDCVLYCPLASCQARLEMTLGVADLLVPPYAEAAHAYHETVVVDQVPYEIVFRLLTAWDLEVIAQSSGFDPERAARDLLRRCILRATRNGTACDSGELPAVACDTVADAMSRHDPQAELEIDLTCPTCHAPFSVVFDTASFLLQEIDQAAARVLREVHILASSYGWNEDEILRVPPARRARYIELVASTSTSSSPVRAQ